MDKMKHSSITDKIKGGEVKGCEASATDDFSIGCWNIRMGFIKREHEIINPMNTNKLSVLFLVETDSMNIHT